MDVAGVRREVLLPTSEQYGASAPEPGTFAGIKEIKWPQELHERITCPPTEPALLPRSLAAKTAAYIQTAAFITAGPYIRREGIPDVRLCGNWSAKGPVSLWNCMREPVSRSLA